MNDSPSINGAKLKLKNLNENDEDVRSENARKQNGGLKF